MSKVVPSKGAARYGNIAVMLLHDAIGAREAEARPFAHLFRGEEGLEDTFHGLFVHAGAGIRHGESHVLARTSESMGLREVLVYLCPFCRDGERASVGHGIPGVGGEVHEDLAYLGDIEEARGILIGEVHREADVLGQESS